MRMTLKDLVEEVNQRLEGFEALKTEDSRIKSVLSERRVRSYISNGLLHKPIRIGGEIYYDESHLEKLLAIRGLQNSGMSENTIKSMSSVFPQENNLISSPPLYESLSFGGVQENASIEGKKAALSSFLSSISSSSGAGANQLNLTASSAVNSMPIASPLNASLQSRSVFNKDALDGSQKNSNYISEALTSVSKTSVKSIQEYALDDLGKISLRVEDGASISNPGVVLEKIKKILNIKED